jgi:hypothetical protein
MPHTRGTDMSETADDSGNGPKESGGKKRESHWVAGDKVVSTIKEILHQGNVRHIVIKNEEGKTLIEVPVSVGVAGALLLPVWAAVGAAAAMVTKCSIEVERMDDEEAEGETAVAKDGKDDIEEADVV